MSKPGSVGDLAEPGLSEIKIDREGDVEGGKDVADAAKSVAG